MVNVVLFSLAVVLVLAFAVGLLFFQAWVVQWGWNLLTPWDMTFWQALAACVLLSVVGGAFKAVTR